MIIACVDVILRSKEKRGHPTETEKMKYLALLLSILVIGAQCGVEVLRGKSGSMNSKKYKSFKIVIPAGRKIAIQIENLRLKSKGLLQIRNQQTGRRIQFKMQGNTLYKIFPTTIELDARVLRIWAKKTRIFLARYAVFVDGGDNCRKNRVGNVTLVSCNSGDVNPVAETCDVTLSCPRNFLQDRNSLTCRQGFWYGNPECVPDENIVSRRCRVESESTQAPPSCPYSAELLAHYLVTHGTELETMQSDRSSGRTIDCRYTCKRGTNGWAVDCGSPPNKSVYIRCWVCRVYAKCAKQSVIFA